MDNAKAIARLTSLRDELTQQTQSLHEASATVELDQTRQGRLSRMDAMQAQQMAVAASRRNQQKLRQVDAALKRVEAGEYGECAACGEMINARRLKLDPTSTRCVPCLEKATDPR